MTRLWEFVLYRLSRLLEADERAAVIGDLAELNVAPPRSVCELGGLIVRRQSELWKDWRPWLVLLGVVGLVGVRVTVLAGTLIAVPLQYFLTYSKYGVLYESGLSLSEEVITWLSHASAVILWSWTAGFVFTLLSRKTALFTGALLTAVWLCLNVALLSLFRWHSLSLLLLIPSLLFFLPAVWGACRAFRCGPLPVLHAVLLAAVTVGVIALVTWTSGWLQAALDRGAKVPCTEACRGIDDCSLMWS